MKTYIVLVCGRYHIQQAASPEDAYEKTVPALDCAGLASPAIVFEAKFVLLVNGEEV